MLTRIKNRTLHFISEKPFYQDRFFIMTSEKYSFRTFGDYVNFFVSVHSLLEKAQIPSELRDYFTKVFSFLSSSKTLCLENFSNSNPVFDKDDYATRVQNALDSLFTDYKVEGDYFSIYEPRQISDDEYSIVYDSVKSSRKCSQELLMSIKESDDRITADIALTEELYNGYENYIVGMIEVNTGDFDTDLFLSVLEEMVRMSLSKDIQSYEARNITIQHVHVEVALAVNTALQLLCYMKNCYSFRNGTLEVFDEMEFETRLDTIRMFLSSAKR